MTKLNIPSIPLGADGAIHIPVVGFGTGTHWFDRTTSAEKPQSDGSDGVKNQTLYEHLLAALEAGYTHIDTAESYGTEADCGHVIKHYLETSGVSRSSLFITTKISSSLGDPEKAISDLLSRLRLDYVDLYLIHSPFTEHDIVEAWRKIERLVDEGKVRAIGVSNFRISDFETLLPHCRIRPVVNQIEHHPHLLQPDLIDYCRSHQITIESYGPLAPIAYIRDGPSPLQPVLTRLASKYGKNEAQVLVRWNVQRGHIPITTTTKVDRIVPNAEVFDFEMTEDELKEIETVGASFHYRRFWTDKY
eukprot:comp19516_c1_seq1/m.22810 comp19516_c1_seq1/g.22810  ORF comp19516_c1_seq1/g.22810 comp19516_c1_seq1/m.22810 type:complete len:304 (-) comp19516_c1_seq1:105-1016(-)